jgi:hypothetical protein
MRSLLINNLINSIDTGLVKLDHRYNNYVEIEYKNGAQIFESVKLNPKNINDFKIKTGLRGYLLMEWIKQGNECLIKYDQIVKPGNKSFDSNLLEYFTTDELELIDYKFFGKKLYSLDQHSFNLLIESLNYILDFCKDILNDEVRNAIKDINNIYEYENNKLLLVNGETINNLYGYVNLKKDIRRKDFDKMLGLTILKDLKN